MAHNISPCTWLWITCEPGDYHSCHHRWWFTPFCALISVIKAISTRIMNHKDDRVGHLISGMPQGMIISAHCHENRTLRGHVSIVLSVQLKRYILILLSVTILIGRVCLPNICKPYMFIWSVHMPHSPAPYCYRPLNELKLSIFK